MKRHKYVFPKFIKKLHKNPPLELKYISTNLIKSNIKLFNNSVNFSIGIFLKNLSLHPSKINTYCLITGRTKFTVKNTQTSRHIFFEYCTNGYNTGFFQS